MPLWKIAWRSIQRRSLASLLTALSMALGVMLIVAVLLIHGVVEESFRNNSYLGYNMIIGAKGGKLQLVLNTVFYLSTPVENIPYSLYQEFLPADQRPDGQDGKWKPYVTSAIPVCLGDYYRQYRVVGTIPDMFDGFVYDEETGEAYEFAQGRNFRHWSEEYGFFEAVVGAKVARELNLEVGDPIKPTHGSEEGAEHDQFYVVGILKPSGTPNDRAVFVNMEGFYLLEGHAKPVASSDADETETDRSPGDPEDSSATVAATAPNDAGSSEAPASHLQQREPLPLEQREVTALLVRTVSPLVTPGLSNTINEGQVAQAVLPVQEITALFERIVRPFQRVLLLLTAMICIVSGISILVSIYNSMSDRQREIAVMRSLGAGRRTVMMIVLLEAVILSLGGGLVGWATGHALIGVASPMIEAETGVTIGPFDMAPPVNLVALFSEEPLFGIDLAISTEWILVPFLIGLAVLVGFLPALAAYRTDVAQALTANP